MTNKEKFKTPEERKEAFLEFCTQKKCDKCECSKQGKKDISLCEFMWLTLEVEEEKPLACPLCGGEAVAVQPWLTGGASVICKKCGTFIWAPTQAEAIATWNRSAK